MDGFGESKLEKGNAVLSAQMPFLNSLKKKYPHTLLDASGEAVGLPPGVTGASEPGHIAIGAGRVIWQPLENINRSIRQGDFPEMKKIKEIFRYAKEKNKNLHLLGMISDGKVHSDLQHLFALLELAKEWDLKKVFIYGILDGRDVPERSAAKYLKEIERKIKKLGVGQLASLCGRFFAMDRDQNWDRTKAAYDLLVHGLGHNFSSFEEEYQESKTDYYVRANKMKGFQAINPNDALIFWNFRADRSVQLSQALLEKKFPHFENKELKLTPQISEGLTFLAFGPYVDPDLNAFQPEVIKNNLGEVLEINGRTQLRIAETEKYAHVTFYFNSQNKDPFPHEKRILIPSPKCNSYAEKPHMSAAKLTQRVCEEIDKDKHDFIVLNFANPDLVGHSGNLKATKEALEFLDNCLKKVVNSARDKGYEIIITADHGNAEQMIYPGTDTICPSHTTNPVIFLLLEEKAKLKKGQRLASIAPTILSLMEIEKPGEMTGKSLV